MADKQRAQYGAAAYANFRGTLPNPFPRTIGPRAMEYLKEVVDSGLTADMIGRFERAFSQAYGVKHCIATPGCTPALAILAASLVHCGMGPGDEIIVSPITDYGSLQGIVQQGFIPVFADTAPGTVNLSANTIEPCISPRTRAILVVHKTGLVCDMDPINELAKRHGLMVFEDACQAVFSTYKGRLAGRLGLAAGFSFDNEKTMGSDTGGCLITDDDGLAEYMRFVGHSRGAQMQSGFGRVHVVPGMALRMPSCTAAISLAQLEIIGENVAQREVPGVTPLPIPAYQEVYSAWMFGMSIDPAQFACDAESFAAQLAEAGIPGAGTGKYYLMPAALTFLQDWARSKRYPYSTPPASREYAYSTDSCPRAWQFLQTWIRWATFCEKYTEEHCHLAAQIVRTVADRNRR